MEGLKLPGYRGNGVEARFKGTVTHEPLSVGQMLHLLLASLVLD